VPRPAFLDPLPLRPAWYLRSLWRQPSASLLASAALAAVVLVAAAQSLAGLARQAMLEAAVADAPSLVLRRLGPGGFEPLPLEEGRRAALGVRGVLAADGRLWGVVAEEGRAVLLEAGATGSGDPERTLAGPDGRTRIVRSRAVAPDAARGGMPRRWAAEADVRDLLGLPAGTVTDLALKVYQEAEEEAIRPAVEVGMPWPVRVATRGEEARAARLALARGDAGDVFRLAPAVLALALLVLAALREGPAGRREVALRRALGWTTSDLVRERLSMALIVGVPGVAAGLAAAWLLVVSGAWPGVGEVLVGTPLADGAPPPAAGEALLAMAQVAALVLSPWLAASLARVVAAATADPDGLAGEGGAA
jgi:hypothetical protein